MLNECVGVLTEAFGLEEFGEFIGVPFVIVLDFGGLGSGEEGGH